MALRSNHFVNWTFQSPISVQTVGERPLASNQQAVRQCRLILLKDYEIFDNTYFEILFIFKKKLCERVLSYDTWYLRRCLDCQMALRTDHFVDCTFGESN